MMMEHAIALAWRCQEFHAKITCCTYYIRTATAAAVPWPLFKTCMRQLVRTTSTPISIQQLDIWSLLRWLIEKEASAVGVAADTVPSNTRT